MLFTTKIGRTNDDFSIRMIVKDGFPRQEHV